MNEKPVDEIVLRYTLIGIALTWVAGCFVAAVRAERKRNRPKGNGFWNGKSIRELVVEQGVKPLKRIEDLQSPCMDDVDIDAFLSEIYGARA